jgi:putative transposase
VKKGQLRYEDFDDKILALYARGMNTHDFQAPLQELYGVEVSPALISNVSEAMMDEVRQSQA